VGVGAGAGVVGVGAGAGACAGALTAGGVVAVEAAGVLWLPPLAAAAMMPIRVPAPTIPRTIFPLPFFWGLGVTGGAGGGGDGAVAVEGPVHASFHGFGVGVSVISEVLSFVLLVAGFRPRESQAEARRSSFSISAVPSS
jgi:hypothetical protein